jgi:hypothetical protein
VRRRCRVERRHCAAFSRETESSFDEGALLFAAASQAGKRDPLSYSAQAAASFSAGFARRKRFDQRHSPKNSTTGVVIIYSTFGTIIRH